MGLFDKMKDVVDKAKDGAANLKNDFDNMQSERKQKKFEEAALDAEFRAKATEKGKELEQNILDYGDDSQGGFYGGLSDNDIMSFAKEFYSKILLPANSVKKSYITMYPYLNDKITKTFVKKFSNHGENEQDIIHIKDPKNQEFLLTTKNFYFKVCLEENEKYFAMGQVPCANINTFSLEKHDSYYTFKCDTFELAKLAINDSYEEDFVTLNNYFKCIEEKDFEITDEEVDSLIKEKIGDKVYSEVKKYMVYDDELMLYFAWGLDSLTAKDYIVCTNKQIIILDREMFGATANVKQLYYEDISAMSTNQNSKSNDLTGFLLDTAVTALTNTCELMINFAGGVHKIETLLKPEAERVVEIYHQCRKARKEAEKQPVVIQAQQQPDVLEQIQKLSALKDAKIITEEEFNEKKADLLAKL